jgi:hypothetical protein
VPGEALTAREKTVQLKIDALNEAAARPGAGQRTTVVPASQLLAAGLHKESRPPAEPYAGREPGQGKETP